MSRIDEIRELTRVRVLSFLREPEAIFWVFLFPLLLAAVLAFAFRSGDIEPSRVIVVDGPDSARLVEAFAVDEHLKIDVLPSRDAAMTKLRTAAADGVVEGGDPPRLSFDPQRPEAETARLRVLRALGLALEGGADPPLDEHLMTEAGSRYVDFLFPGLIGMNLMGTGMWGVGFAIADVRRRKFLKRMLVTPMRRSSFFLAFMNSRLVFLAIELTVLLGFGVWILGVPLRGNLIALVTIALLGAAMFAGLGILVASRVRTIEGVSGLMNFVMMPMWLASGVFFSYEKFPAFIQPALKLLPLTALNDALRAVMLDGASILTQGPELGVMAAWWALCLGIALRIFRWE